ncbi:hypothetical protein KIN20_003479 [Parelaphostrongylus tenuis]|uniref:Uncharacterized protein n=1 Tax=Parelaphostrongylus tenuis TaxID=148309 RepID=A0AAD5QDR4_PARTN|nr:hypothetical protein KIN20_003479 [Parelaphostrongylus tenuis]
MSFWLVLSALFCSQASFLVAIKCYVGQELFRDDMLLGENVGLADCQSSFCVRQYIVSNYLTTVNLMCDRGADIVESFPVICQKDGTYICNGPNSFCVNICCSSDYCNLSRNAGGSFHYVMASIVVLFHKFLF